MREKRHPYIAYILLILMLGMTFWFSSQQGMNSHSMSINVCEKIVAFLDHNANLRLDEKQFFNLVKFMDVPIRKAAHMAEYAVLGVVLYVIVSTYFRSIWKRTIFVIGLLILLGSVDEVHQLYVVAREGKWQDVVVDVIGGCVGLAVALGIYRKKRNGEEDKAKCSC